MCPKLNLQIDKTSRQLSGSAHANSFSARESPHSTHTFNTVKMTILMFHMNTLPSYDTTGTIDLSFGQYFHCHTLWDNNINFNLYELRKRLFTVGTDIILDDDLINFYHSRNNRLLFCLCWSCYYFL